MNNKSLPSVAHAHLTRQRLATEQEFLSYELGKSVKELPPLYTRALGLGIVALLAGTLSWAHFSQVDEVAIAQGKLVSSEDLRPVRSLGTGTIKAVRVKEGDRVTAGQLLVERDPAISQAEIERLEKTAQLIREDVARLDAERLGAGTAGAVLQDELLTARLKDFAARRAEAIAQANRQLAVIEHAKIRHLRLQDNLASAKAHLANTLTKRSHAEMIVSQTQASLQIAEDREQAIEELLTPGAVSRFQYLELQDRSIRTKTELIKAKEDITRATEEIIKAQDQVVSLEKDIAAQAHEISQAEQTYEAAQSTATRLFSERQSEIIARLNHRREELAAIEGQLVEAKRQQELETLEAPVSGTVYNVKATTGPVQSGEELLSILPEGEEILLEVKVLNQDIGFIALGMPTKVKLATFPFQEFGTVEGQVVAISPNAVLDEKLGLVFPTKIKLRQQSIQLPKQGSTRLTPGMAATGEIVLRQKSILAFVIEPVVGQLNEAFSVR